MTKDWLQEYLERCQACTDEFDKHLSKEELKNIDSMFYLFCFNTLEYVVCHRQALEVL